MVVLLFGVSLLDCLVCFCWCFDLGMCCFAVGLVEFWVCLNCVV